MNFSNRVIRLLMVAAMLVGCSPATGSSSRRVDPSTVPDAGSSPSHPGSPSCDGMDTDGDGIADAVEGTGDLDGDGVVNYLDGDSDADGVLDRDEARSSDPCGPVDSDADGLPDFLDTDSDNDGLTDGEELGTYSTDPTSTDSDGDGVSDLAEARGTMTDPNDAASTIDPDDFFLVLPFGGAGAVRELSFGTEISIADVFFLVDMTGSMRQERTNLISGLTTTIIPGVEASVANAQFGVGGLDDYPTGGYGAGDDLPFYLLSTIIPGDQDRGAWSLSATASSCPSGAHHDIGSIAGSPNGVPDILEAVQGLPCHSGSDGPESYVPALHATASGTGLSWTGGSIPDQSCMAVTGETEIRRGYPCFRPGALPIILLFGDYSFHNGPRGSENYSGFGTPSYTDTVASLNGLGARVIGIYSADSASYRADYEAIAHDTGAVRADGSSLVFDIGSTGLGLDSTVVDAVAELVGGTPQDVGTRTENELGNPDSFDATTFIKAIVPVRSYYEENGIEVPGVTGMDDRNFYGVIPGTQVTFSVEFLNDVRVPTTSAEIFRARIVVVGNGVADLDSRNVYIIVPPEGHTILI